MKIRFVMLALIAGALVIDGMTGKAAAGDDLDDVPDMTPIAYCVDRTVADKVAGMAGTPGAMQIELDSHVGDECDLLRFAPVHATAIRAEAVSFGPCKVSVRPHAFRDVQPFTGYVLYMEDRCL